MIAPVDERGAALELLDEEAEEMALIRIVYPFYAPLGDDAAAISLRRNDGLDEMAIVLLELDGTYSHYQIILCLLLGRAVHSGPFRGVRLRSYWHGEQRDSRLDNMRSR